jgi:DNA-binding transcriptional LysR family regulator
MVAGALADVATAGDGVELHLADGRNDELVAGLDLGRFDLIIGIGPAPTDAFEAHAIVDDQMLLLAPATHPLAQAERQPWRALRGHDVVHFKGGSIGSLASAALTAHGLKATDRFRFDHVASLHAVVSTGLSLALLPRLYADALPENPRLRLVELTEPVVTRQIALIHRRQLASEHPPAWAVADALRRATARRRPSPN